MEDVCRCEACREEKGVSPLEPQSFAKYFRYACEICGNKRCPHHKNHKFKCTGSNEPHQIGEEE